MANLNNISTALDNLSDTLETELQQIADALRDSPSQTEVDTIAQRVLDLKDRIANIIP
jgi:predicted transcriptional regulator